MRQLLLLQPQVSRPGLASALRLPRAAIVLFSPCCATPLFCSYDSFGGLPSWAQDTLMAHAEDPRPRLYSAEELERALTHDRHVC